MIVQIIETIIGFVVKPVYAMRMCKNFSDQIATGIDGEQWIFTNKLKLLYPVIKA